MAWKAHDEQTKAAVMAALLAGQSISDVARQFKLSKSTVSSWRNAAGMATAFEPKKASELGDLIADYLRETLTTLQVQASLLRDETYVRRQPASEIAVLHGVLADKAVRILAALDHGDEES